MSAYTDAVTLWESNMHDYGIIHGDALATVLAGTDQAAVLADPTTNSNGPTFTPCIYDRQRVMLQIAAYRSETTPWTDYAADARTCYDHLYVDKFVPNQTYRTDVSPTIATPGGQIPAYWSWSNGMKMRWDAAADAAAKQRMFNLATGGATYSNTYYENAHDPAVSREVAYNLMHKWNSQLAGNAADPFRQECAEITYNNLARLMDTQAWRGTTEQVSPFIGGLIAQALILDFNQTADSRCVPTLLKLANFWWDTAWLPYASAFTYDINPLSPTGSYGPAPDLNMILAPLYGWVYYKTGDTTHRDRGDAIFVGGANGAYVQGDKQFNQSYWWSFDYLTYRGTTPSLPPPPTQHLPPTVSITQPTTGSSVARKSRQVIKATATSTVGIAKVDFYVGLQGGTASLLASVPGSTTSTTYTASWKVPGSPGKTYAIFAVAFDLDGVSTTSSTITVRS